MFGKTAVIKEKRNQEEQNTDSLSEEAECNTLPKME